MTQEVEITLTLEVDVKLSKYQIKADIENMLRFYNGNISIKDIKEESELYKTE